jgi:hypothetical protein
LSLPKSFTVLTHLIVDLTVEVADVDFVLVSESLKGEDVCVHGLDHTVKVRNWPRMTVNSKTKLTILANAGAVSRNGTSLFPRKIHGVFKSFTGVSH